MTSLISVIIPCFRFDEYLTIALKSIKNQTYTNLEVLVIDDSFGDEIKYEVDNLNDCRFKHIIGEKRGLAAALNFGIDLSIGDYIARMDADDYSLSNRLQVQLDYLKLYNLDLCGTNIKLFGNINQLTKFPESNEEIIFNLLITCPIAHPTVFAKAELFKKYKYDINIFAAEDYELWCRMALNKVKFGNVQQFLLEYRTHEKQISKTDSKHKDNVHLLLDNYSSKYLDFTSYSKFASLNYGLSSKYTTKEIYELSLFIRNIMKDKSINLNNVTRYVSSLQLRITDINLKTLFIYIRILRKFGHKVNLIILFYLLLNLIWNINPHNKRIAFFRNFF